MQQRHHRLTKGRQVKESLNDCPLGPQARWSGRFRKDGALHLPPPGRWRTFDRPRQDLRWLDECLAKDPQILEDAKQARALSGSSTVQAECCEQRERLARR